MIIEKRFVMLSVVKTILISFMVLILFLFLMFYLVRN